MIRTHPFLFVLLILGAIAFFLATVLRPLGGPLAQHPWLVDFRARLIAFGLLMTAIVALYLAAQ